MSELNSNITTNPKSGEQWTHRLVETSVPVASTSESVGVGGVPELPYQRLFHLINKDRCLISQDQANG